MNYLDIKVQVFIPTYNRSRMLMQAIDSVQKQSHANIEIIILDNASQDDTQEIVHSIVKCEPRLRYIRKDFNVGMSENFNSISKLVTAPYFCVLTDDDIYEQHFLNTALSLFFENPTAFAVVLNAPTRKDGLVIGSQLSTWREGFYPHGSAISFCLNGRHPILTNCLFRKEIASIFYFEPQLGGSADIYFFVKLFTNYPSVVSKVVTGYYDLHSSNITIMNNGLIGLRQTIVLRRMINRYLSGRCVSDKLEYRISKWYFALASLVYYSNTAKELSLACDDEEIIGYFGLLFKNTIRICSVPIIFIILKNTLSNIHKVKHIFLFYTKKQ